MFNIEEFKNTFADSKIVGNKILLTTNICNAIRFVKDNYGFEMLKEIIAIDNQEHGIELIYKLYSISNKEDLLISITTSDRIESISNIFKSAISDECEIFDLFGINFIGNENLKRLYMPESWQGHPLRKNYAEEDRRLSWNE